MLEASLEKLNEAKAKGAKFLVGSAEKASVASLKPAIITGVTKEMQIADDEAFGPSFSLYVVKTEKEAIDMANDTRYGLNAAVHSMNMDHALEVAKQLDNGQIHINSMTVHDERKCFKPGEM